MKRIACLLLIIFTAGSVCAQNVYFDWVKQMGGSGSTTIATALAVDAAGNSYTTGFFKGGVDFDPGPGVVELESGNAGALPDMFICKLNAGGGLVWVRQIGCGTGAGGADGFSIAVDGSGNIYTLGAFSGTVDFDPGAGVFPLSSSASIFISKLDAAGNFAWVRPLDIVEVYEQGNLIAADAAGNVYMTGAFTGTVDFDPGPALFNLSAGTNRDMFVSKFNTSGDFLWAKQIGNGTGGVDGTAIALDAAGNIFTTGRFLGVEDFDPGPAVFNLASSSAETIFVAKLDAAGNYVWAKAMAGTDPTGNEGLSVAVDAAGNVYSTGFFAGSVDFDPGPGAFNLTALGDDDIFVSKLNASGQFVWATHMGGNGSNTGNSITTDASGSVYIAGGVQGTVDFNPDDCLYDFTAAGGTDMVVSKLNAAGQFLWVKQIGGTGDEQAKSIVVGSNGDVYTAGNFSGTVDFDPGMEPYDLNPAGGYDAFVHKMIPCANNTSSLLTVSACGTYTLNCKTYTSGGVYTQLLSNAAGCDSTITLNLTISNSNSLISRDTTVCGSYFWNGRTLTGSGEYRDTLKAAGGCDSILVLNLTVNPAPVTNIVRAICAGQSYSGYTETGLYTDIFPVANGCDSTRSLQLTVDQHTAPDLASGQGLCPGDTLNLYPGVFTDYRWQDGSTQGHYTVKRPGLYAVQVSNACGSWQTQVVVREKTCNILFPSAFTPNQDGRNEQFKVLNAPILTNYQLSVYSRWGQKVFETRDYSKGWDGSSQGQLAESGTYVWFCSFKKPDSPQMVEMRGTVVLIR